MAESAALLVDEVLPEQPIRQWVLSFPFQLRYLFASRPEIMGRVLGIVYRVIATHLIRQAGHTHTNARTGSVTLIQRFGSALNLNIHLHMLFLDGVYVDRPDGSAPDCPTPSLVTPARRGNGSKPKSANVKQEQTPAERRASMTWAQRLKRVLNIDIETCSACGGTMKVIACIEAPVVIKQILDHLAYKAEASELRALPGSRAPPAELRHGLFD